MKNFTFRLMTAVLAFLVGTLASDIRSSWHQKFVATEQTVHAELVGWTEIPETWRKVVVKGQFSFYIPPYLKDEGHYLNRRTASGLFRADWNMPGLYYFDYVADYDNECNSSNSPPRYKWTTISEGTVAGKHAIVVTEIPSRNEIWGIQDSPRVRVCFPDIGDGQKLSLSFASGNLEGIKVTKRILQSIEFVR